MNEAQKDRIVLAAALLLAALILVALIGCVAPEATTCGELCIIYDHEMSFADNMRRFPIDLEQSGGEIMVYLPASNYAADWIVNNTPAYGAIHLVPKDIAVIEIIEPVHTKYIPGDWGEGGVVRVYTKSYGGEQVRLHMESHM